jgi:hypothetical protein
MIYEYGELWWNILDRGKLLTRPLISGNPTSSHLIAEQEEMAKETINLAYETSVSYRGIL